MSLDVTGCPVSLAFHSSLELSLLEAVPAVTPSDTRGKFGSEGPAGASGPILCEGTVDPSSRKELRPLDIRLAALQHIERFF